jgi:hypothetical protein
MIGKQSVWPLERGVGVKGKWIMIRKSGLVKRGDRGAREAKENRHSLEISLTFEERKENRRIMESSLTFEEVKENRYSIESSLTFEERKENRHIM